MTLDSREYLRVARALAQPDASEAALRTAVARTYLAAFQHTVRVLTARGFLPTVRRARDHMTVVVTLRSRPGYRTLGDMLDALRLLRVHADEELDKPLTLVEARRALALAYMVLARIDAMRA